MTTSASRQTKNLVSATIRRRKEAVVRRGSAFRSFYRSFCAFPLFGLNFCGPQAIGNPDPKHISASFAKRQSLSVRMGIRRYTIDERFQS